PYTTRFRSDNRNPGQLGRTPEFIGDLDIEPVSFDLAASIDTARANRPELMRLSKLYEAREAGVKIANSGRLPTLALVGGYEVRKATLSDSFRDSLDGWTVALQSNWAIWDGRGHRRSIDSELSLQELARMQLDVATIGVEVEERRVLSVLNEASDRADAAVKVVEQADEALRLANARYGAGTATQLD